MMVFDLNYLLFVGPALLLGLWAQMRVQSTYAAAKRMPAPKSGAAAAREMLDAAGLHDVRIEQSPGFLSDHYDPREKVLRLSPDVYGTRSLAAVGIAAHEAGHAIQDAQHYAPLVVRNAAVPMASFGSSAGMILLVLGLIMGIGPLLLAGIVVFSAVVFFQLINLPVEFDASNRAKAELVNMNIVTPAERTHVDSVLNAAAWTYVAATLQAILTLVYYLMIYSSRHSDE